MSTYKAVSPEYDHLPWKPIEELSAEAFLECTVFSYEEFIS